MRPIHLASPRAIRLAIFGGLCAGVAVAVMAWYLFNNDLGQPVDALAYWMTRDGELYENPVRLSPHAYLYSPAFAQAIAPITGLDFDTFIAIWRAINLAAFVGLAGPLSAPLLFWSPVASEVNAGNIHLLLGAAIVLGFRWPAFWSFVLLTKVTPGVGLLWFVVRREWRSLAVVAAATAAIVTVSVIVSPRDWLDWFSLLFENTRSPDGPLPIPVPLIARLPLAAAIVIWGARTDRPAVVPVAALVALPVIWFHSLSLLAAVVPLLIWPGARRIGALGDQRRAAVSPDGGVGILAGP
jgi:hypothetical protein